MRLAGTLLLTLSLVGLTTRAHADVILWVDDGSGNIGQVDINTQSVVAGSVHNTGQDLTDIGFNSAGTLYGTGFDGLFSINTTTGAATSLGSYGFETDMNALVGSGGTGLLAAAADSLNIYSINPSSPSTQTVDTTSPADSAGDLAFAGNVLYESGVAGNGNDELIDVSTGTVVGLFHVGTTGGAELNGVFGLADDGTTMYAVNGTIVYSVNLTTGVLTELFDYSTAENGQDLGAANGTAFIGEGSTATPEPNFVFFTVLAGLGVVVAKKRFGRSASTKEAKS